MRLCRHPALQVRLRFSIFWFCPVGPPQHHRHSRYTFGPRTIKEVLAEGESLWEGAFDSPNPFGPHLLPGDLADLPPWHACSPKRGQAAIIHVSTMSPHACSPCPRSIHPEPPEFIALQSTGRGRAKRRLRHDDTALCRMLCRRPLESHSCGALSVRRRSAGYPKATVASTAGTSVARVPYQTTGQAGGHFYLG